MHAASGGLIRAGRHQTRHAQHPRTSGQAPHNTYPCSLRQQDANGLVPALQRHPGQFGQWPYVNLPSAARQSRLQLPSVLLRQMSGLRRLLQAVSSGLLHDGRHQTQQRTPQLRRRAALGRRSVPRPRSQGPPWPWTRLWAVSNWQRQQLLPMNVSAGPGITGGLLLVLMLLLLLLLLFGYTRPSAERPSKP